MKRIIPILSISVSFLACGDGRESGTEEPARVEAPAPAPPVSAPASPSGPLSIPGWYAYDDAANSVHITLVAGETDRNNYWNYNGAIRGELDITVPLGTTVTIDMVNNDPAMAHSVGVSAELENFGAPPAPIPVFEGAITPDPQSMTVGGLPGETQTMTFVADAAGEYSLVCYIPGHSAVGMWLYFTVSADGEAGVQGL